MEADKFFHILNPNQSTKSFVQKTVRKNPRLSYIWVEKKTHPTHLETIIEWALLNKHKNLAIWGGDGSLSRVLQGLYEREALDKVALALVPVGTGNDFSRKVGLFPIRKRIDKIFTKEAMLQSFDLGLLEFGKVRRIFVNNAGFGRTPAAINVAHPNPIKDIFSFSPKRVTVEWLDKGTQQFETYRPMLGIVFNSPFFNKGLYFDKSIDPQDGVLDGILVPYQSKTGLLKRFLGGRLGCSLLSPSDVRLTGEKFTMECDELLYPQVDGEKVSRNGAKSVQFSVLKKSFQLLTVN